MSLLLLSHRYCGFILVARVVYRCRWCLQNNMSVYDYVRELETPTPPKDKPRGRRWRNYKVSHVMTSSDMSRLQLLILFQLTKAAINGILAKDSDCYRMLLWFQPEMVVVCFHGFSLRWLW